MKKTIDITRLEILKIARELAVNEYIDRRAQEHSDWLSKSSELWKTQRMMLAYPVIPPYPTEREIIARAKTLIDFLLVDTVSTVEYIISELDTKIELVGVDTDIEFTEEAEYSNLNDVVAEAIDTSFEDPAMKDDTYSSKLPQIMKSLQEIKILIGDKKYNDA